MKEGSKQLFDEVRSGVEERLGTDASGHGMDHIDRVYSLAIRFDDYYTVSDSQLVGLAALLHDVDDYKLVGKQSADQLQNATVIMAKVGVSEPMQTSVRGIISHMGYSKALRGVRPTTLEGMIVSDADMCDAIGANGVVRCLTYALSKKGSGVVYDPHVWPMTDMAVDQYNGSATHTTHVTDSFINHFFEKLLRLKGMMQTEPGRQEAVRRDELMVHFLRQYFDEQNRPEWVNFLQQYLRER